MRRPLLLLGLVIHSGFTCVSCLEEPVATMTVRSQANGPISKVALIDSFNAGFKAATRIMEKKILAAFGDVKGMEALRVSVSPVSPHQISRRQKQPRRGFVARRKAIARLIKKLRAEVLAMRIPSAVNWDSSSRNPFSLSAQAQQLRLPTQVFWGPVPQAETLPFAHTGMPLTQQDTKSPRMIVFENNNFEDDIPEANSETLQTEKENEKLSEIKPTVISLKNFLKKNFNGSPSTKDFKRTHEYTHRASPLPGAF